MNTDFPEDLFPPINQAVFDYNTNQGKKISSTKSIVFCGIIRNVENTIQRNIACLHRTGKVYKEYKIYLYENDSFDNTVNILKNIQDKNIDFVSESRSDMDYIKDLYNGIDPWHYNRCRILAECRNKYLSKVYDKYSHFDYMCVVDMDVKGGWSYDGIFSGIKCLESQESIACVSSYGIVLENNKLKLEDIENNDYIFYDSFAFRPKNISGGTHMLDTLKFNSLKFNRGDEPIEVRSNFNGLAIYKIHKLHGIKYGAKSWQDGHTDPDHVVFHDQLINYGYKIMLDPSMIVSYSDHKYSRI